MIPMKIALALLVFTTSGCTMLVRTNPVSVTSATSVPSDRVLIYQVQRPEYFTMTVTRDEGVMGSGCFIGLEIDGKLAARIDPSETAKFYIPSPKPTMRVLQDPYGQGLCGVFSWTPVEENYILKPEQNNLFRISLGAYRRPRLVPALQ